MKKLFTVILSTMLAASLAACGTPAATAPATSEPTPSVESSVSSEAGSSMDTTGDQEVAPIGTDPLYVADAAQYIGTVDDLAVNDKGQTVLMLRRPAGTDFVPTLKAVITDDTQYSFDKSTLGNGSFIEVFYGGDTTDGAEVDAIAINDMIAEDMYYYNGKLVEVTPDPDNEGSGSLLLDPLTEGGMQYVFNYSPETMFVQPLDSLKPGMELNVKHSPISTRSLPPQSPALMVSPYTAPAEGEQPIAIPSDIG